LPKLPSHSSSSALKGCAVILMGGNVGNSCGWGWKGFECYGVEGPRVEKRRGVETLGTDLRAAASQAPLFCALVKSRVALFLGLSLGFDFILDFRACSLPTLSLNLFILTLKTSFYFSLVYFSSALYFRVLCITPELLTTCCRYLCYFITNIPLCVPVM